MYVSDWYPISMLRPIEEDISFAAYTNEYINANKLKEKKRANCSSEVPVYHACFFEPIEVQEKDCEILWRENDDLEHSRAPKSFVTQFGSYINHDNGEFSSWIEIDDGKTPSNNHSSGMSNRWKISKTAIDGNFQDVFDCGPYVFAVSNLMHLGLGSLSVIRIGKDLQPVTMYDNIAARTSGSGSCFEYFGKYRDKDGYVLIVSGFTYDWPRSKYPGTDNLKKSTCLFRVCENGSFAISKEWNIMISSSNSFAVKDGYAWFGQNKMVSRLDLNSGDLRYYTNKTNEELVGLYKEE